MFKLKRKQIYLCVLLLGLVLVIVSGKCVFSFYHVERMKGKGMEIVDMIEKYKTKHGGLYPDSLQQLGIDTRTSNGASLYKGSEFFYDCILGGEFDLCFYYSDQLYLYRSVLATWGKGNRAKERNTQVYELHRKIMSPENQKKISEKWIYDSIYYSKTDSQNVANVRLFYNDGKIAARGIVLLSPDKTKIGMWIYYTRDGVGLNVSHESSHVCGNVIKDLAFDYNL